MSDRIPMSDSQAAAAALAAAAKVKLDHKKLDFQ